LTAKAAVLAYRIVPGMAEAHHELEKWTLFERGCGTPNQIDRPTRVAALEKEQFRKELTENEEWI
jgi:hypothetical protein